MSQLNKKYVKAFVTNIGGRTSHSGIMARSSEIPAIVGTKDITERMEEDDQLIVDGMNGDVYIDPTQEEVSAFNKKAKEYDELKLEWEKLKRT